MMHKLLVHYHFNKTLANAKALVAYVRKNPKYRDLMSASEFNLFADAEYLIKKGNLK